jgi:hypothetical protein
VLSTPVANGKNLQSEKCSMFLLRHLWVVEFSLSCKQSDVAPDDTSGIGGNFSAGVVDNDDKICHLCH